MADCCDADDCRSVFTGRFARRVARRYSKHGLNPTAERIVRFVADRGVQGATVLEIGGGIGEIQLELLRRGAARATNLEISSGYEQEAALLLERYGMADRVTRRFVDIADSPEAVEPADVVILNRVVCCYPDYERLLSAAGSHARRLLVYSHPAATRVIRAAIWADNVLRRLRGNRFRAYVHPPEAMLAAAEGVGFETAYRHQTSGWDVVGLVRAPGEATAG
jgi:magnesium-protoporphyrin O-methyltransferase